MNWFDFVLIAVIGGSVIAGFVKGITRVGIGLAAMVIGILCALWFYGYAAAPLAAYISSREVRHIIGFLAIFFAVILLGNIVSWALAKLFKWVHLTWLDRLLGGVFGLARGVLVSAVIILVIMGLGAKSPPQCILRSRLCPYVIHTSRAIAALAPHDLKQDFQRSYQKAREIWVKMVGRGVREAPSDKL